MPMPPVLDISRIRRAERLSRRQLVQRLTRGASGVIGLAGIAAVGGRLAVAAGQDDDDDKDRAPDDRGGDDRDDDTPVVTGEVPAGSLEIRIVDDDPNGFSPSTLTVEIGQSITFVNAHDDPHTATGAGFDTGIIQPGQTATVVLDRAGTFPFACQIHPVMTGAITVRATGAPASPTAATPEATGATPAAPASGTPAAAPGTTTVTIRDLAFAPATLEIPAGATVRWTNEDPIPHTATADDGSFDTGVIEPGQTGSQTFTEPGRFSYFCAFHPQMQATIVVT